MSTPVLAEKLEVSGISVHPGTINAMSRTADISYTINNSDKGHVILAVYSPENVIVRTIVCGYYESGSYVVTWDGKSDKGANVPNGIYRLRIIDAINNYTTGEKLGSFGGNAGQFKRPSGVAADTAGNVYVADYDNSRIQKFDPAGNYITEWGSKGSGEGQFNYPAGIAISDQGRIYVVDYGNCRVQMFGPDGTYLGQWGSKGSGEGQFNLPRGIAVDRDGNVFVADSGNSRIQKFGPTGNFLLSWGSKGSSNGQFSSPVAVAVSDAGIVYVTDLTGNRVQWFTVAGSYRGGWGSMGSGEGQFNGAYGIAADRSGNVYVSDVANHRVQKFTYDGSYLASWGNGSDSIALVSPSGIAKGSDDSVYIADLSGNAVLKLLPVADHGSLFSYMETQIVVDVVPNLFRAPFLVKSPAPKSGSIFSISGMSNAAVSGASDLFQAPLNPDFVDYLQEQQHGDLQANANSEGTTGSIPPSGVIPEPIDLSHLSGKEINLTQATLEVPNFNVTGASYPWRTPAFDLRTTRVTSVKAQGQWGNCWAFATYASLESNLRWWYGETQDFSENNLKNKAGFHWPVDEGGNSQMSMAYLTRWDGPVNEGQDRYHSLSSPDNLPLQKHVQNAPIIPARTNALDNEYLKWGIYCYGAVYTAFYVNYSEFTRSKGTNPGLMTYYHDGSNSTEGLHAVAIVGWDDNFNKTNFVTNATGDGAFICKNSWGTGWGDGGYFYISYYDVGVGYLENAIFTGEPVTNYENIYQYDPLGWTGNIGFGSDTAWFAANYRANGNEDLKAVGFYVPQIGSDYTVTVYTGATLREELTVIGRSSGSVAMPGYKTVRFGSPIHLNPGQEFRIEVRLYTPGYSMPICTEDRINGYSSGAISNLSETFASPDGRTWYDMFDRRRDSSVCIKAYTSTSMYEPDPTPVPPPPPGPFDDDTPTTIIVITGGQPGNNSWYLSNVTVSMSAQDKSGLGIKQIKYSFDNRTWFKYAKPFNITNEGTTTVNFYGEDNAGHSGAVQTRNIRVDRTLPWITGSVMSSPTFNGWYRGEVVVHFEADDVLSGLESVTRDQTMSSDGPNHLVIGTATDLAGNKVSCTVKVDIDNSMPETSCSLSGTTGNNEWFISDVRVDFSATDENSGVKFTEYSLDGGHWLPAIPFILNQEGLTTVYYRSVDQVGNVEAVKTTTVKIDKTPPVITGRTVNVPGAGGWFQSDVIVHFDAADTYSSVASVTPDQTLNSDGPHQSVIGTATDNAGNSASVAVRGINIDMFPPVTRCILEGVSAEVGEDIWYRSQVNVTLSSTDGAGIGVEYTELKINHGPWFRYTGHFNITTEGVTTLYYRSVDMLSHVEQDRITAVKIDYTPPRIYYSILSPPAVDGWYNDLVKVHFSGWDDYSGVGQLTQDVYLSGDGFNQSVVGYVYDMAGNMNWTMVSGINIDRNAPVTLCNLDQTPLEDGWFNTSVNASFEAFDNTGRGPKLIEYKLNQTAWRVYSPDQIIPVTSEGYNTIYYRSLDNVSNQEPINACSIFIDRTKPAINTIVQGGGEIREFDGEEWYTGNVTVHFDSHDAVSGIKSATPDQMLSQDGRGQIVTGETADLAGNSNTTAILINLDRNAPVTTCQLNGTRGNNSWFVSPVTVTLNASDGGTGVNYSLYSLDNTTWVNYTGPFTLSKQGNATVYYYSVDKINNTEALKVQSIKIDTEKPYLEISKSPSPNSLGWFGGSVALHAKVIDGGSGVAGVTPDIVVATEGGDQAFWMYAWDLAGNVQPELAIVSIDKTVPNTNCSLQGLRGPGDWYGSNVKVTLTVSDVPGASTETKYSYGTPDDMRTYTGPITVSSPGSNTIYYYSTDGSGLAEAVKSRTINIDPLLPEMTCTLEGTMGNDGWYRSDVTASFAASDPGLSGLAKSEYSLDGRVWKPIEKITLTKEGLYSIRYRATTNAGVQATGEETFGIIKTPPKVINATPAENAEDVFVDNNVTVWLQGRIDPSTVKPDTFCLTNGNQKVDSVVKYDTSGQAVLQPLAALDPAATYTVSMTDGVKDLAGNSLAGPVSWTFSTGTSSSAGVTVEIRPTPTPVPTEAPTATPAAGGTTMSLVTLIIAVLAIAGIAAAGAIYFLVLRK